MNSKWQRIKTAFKNEPKNTILALMGGIAWAAFVIYFPTIGFGLLALMIVIGLIAALRRRQ